VVEVRGTTVWLPADVVEIIDKLREYRRDPTRSDTVRYLLLRALCDMSFMPEDVKKALGLQTSRACRGRKIIRERG
jgi:Arc/MetJ-type ribon-helix-helix transcriptional regulator